MTLCRDVVIIGRNKYTCGDDPGVMKDNVLLRYCHNVAV